MKQVKRKEILKNTSNADISIELAKEFFTNKFREQKEKLLNIARNGTSDTKARLGRLAQEMSDNNIKLNALSEETNDLKLTVETLQEIFDNKFKEINHKLNSDKQ